MKKYFEKLDCSWTEDSERLFVTPQNELKNFLFYVQEIGNFSTFHSYFTEREGLNSFLILLTLSGSGTLVYQDKTYQLTKGDVFFIDCNLKHRYFNGRQENWDFLWVHFNGPNTQGCFNFFLSQNQGAVAKVQNDEIEQIMTKLYLLNKHPAPQNDILSFRYLSDLIASLILLGNPTSYSLNTVPQLMLDILTEIDRTFCDPISLNTLAHRFGTDPFVLSRNFKKYFGIGFKEYITAKRISYSKELIRFTDKSIAEISEILSYENTEYFITLFKKYEHTTPLAFRKKWQDNTAE